MSFYKLGDGTHHNLTWGGLIIFGKMLGIQVLARHLASEEGFVCKLWQRECGVQRTARVCRLYNQL